MSNKDQSETDKNVTTEEKTKKVATCPEPIVGKSKIEGPCHISENKKTVLATDTSSEPSKSDDENKLA